MALRDLWGRATGRDAVPAPPPASAAAPVEAEVFVPELDDELLAEIPPELLAELQREAPELLAPELLTPEPRAGDPVPEPPPAQEPPPPIPVPPDDDEPEVEEPPPDEADEEPPVEDPGNPVPIQEPPALVAGVAVSGAAAPAPAAPATPFVALPVVAVPATPVFPASAAPVIPMPAAPVIPVPAAPAGRGGFLGRLREGLRRSTQRLGGGLAGLFTKRKLDDAALEELEDALITADIGVGASRRIVESFRRTRFGREVGDEEVRTALAEEIAAILAPVAVPLDPRAPASGGPRVVLMVGVNGTGKTTTIAKLAEAWRAEGLRVMLAAGDTFRAAAVEQLQVWGERTGCPVVVPAKPGADAAGLAHEALDRARAEAIDVLLIDTAGRLHNKAGLMEELSKVVRVLRKREASAPHDVVLVLDATTGQNAIQQVRVFRDMVQVSGLVVTKLDGSARGGVVVALAQEFGLPVHAVGVGERAADLRPFEPRDYARSLVGLDADQ